MAQVTADRLTAEVALRFLGWRITRDRYLLRGRLSRSRRYFQPTERTADALRLLWAASRYAITREKADEHSAEAEIEGNTGRATESFEALAVTIAIARPIGIEVRQ